MNKNGLDKILKVCAWVYGLLFPLTILFAICLFLFAKVLPKGPWIGYTFLTFGTLMGIAAFLQYVVPLIKAKDEVIDDYRQRVVRGNEVSEFVRIISFISLLIPVGYIWFDFIKQVPSLRLSIWLSLAQASVMIILWILSGWVGKKFEQRYKEKHNIS